VAMIATGKSLNELGSATRFSADSDSMGLYTVGVSQGVWLAVIYEQPLNPGQFRMRVRRYAEILSKFGVEKPPQWEVPANGATLRPESKADSTHPVIPTLHNDILFMNITDDEIDHLFENPRS
ncbi:MAG: hypothetical protein ACXWSD_13790, partial [Bdellovibrionota bacterium]